VQFLKLQYIALLHHMAFHRLTQMISLALS
jgi:hypothetical protein